MKENCNNDYRPNKLLTYAWRKKTHIGQPSHISTLTTILHYVHALRVTSYSANMTLSLERWMLANMVPPVRLPMCIPVDTFRFAVNGPSHSPVPASQTASGYIHSNKLECIYVPRYIMFHGTYFPRTCVPGTSFPRFKCSTVRMFPCTHAHRYLYSLYLYSPVRMFPGSEFFFPTSSDAVIIQFGRLRLRGMVKVTCVDMVRVSKLLGSNINLNPNSNSAITLIMTLNSH